MLFVGWMAIVSGHNVKKTIFGKVGFSGAPNETLHKHVLYHRMHIGHLLSVLTEISRLSPKQWLAPGKAMPLQHPQLHPLGWVPRG